MKRPIMNEQDVDLDTPSLEQEEETAPLAELRLDSVVADPRWNCRRPYSEEEITQAVERFTAEPMLHPPSVCPLGDGRFQLVTGFLRFAVMQRKAYDVGWFRLIRGSQVDLYLWNLAENTARRALSGHELVERVWMLHEQRGVPKDRLAQACGFKVRYLNRLLFIKRRAHPELYELFRRGHPRLSIARLARLVGHEPDEQMQEFRRSEGLLEEAQEVEQGFSERLEDEPRGTRSTDDERRDYYRAPRGRGRRRRRFPPRRQVRRLLEAHERAADLPSQYRRGAIGLLRHLLDGEPLPESLSSDESK